MRIRKQQLGMTLIELMIVVVVLSILAAVAYRISLGEDFCGPAGITFRDAKLQAHNLPANRRIG